LAAVGNVALQIGLGLTAVWVGFSVSQQYS
jgi:hypothetical protein